VTGVLILLGPIARPERRSTPVASVSARPVDSVSFKNVAVSPGPAPAIQEEAPAAPAPTTSPTGVSMVLEFEQDSWTEVTADGAPIFSGLIRRGSKHQFEAREGFRLTLGNAGGVRVTVDGRAMEPLGSAGQVVRNMAVPGPRLTRS
jgi:hypothetical protein